MTTELTHEVTPAESRLEKENERLQAVVDIHLRARLKAEAALAEQVGEPDPHQYVRDELKLVEAATIERCAQVADRYSTSVKNGYETAIAIAATIRKLKDGP